MYKNYPSVEILKIAVSQNRIIEWKRQVIDQGKTIVHAYSRIIKWDTVTRSQVSQDHFSLRKK